MVAIGAFSLWIARDKLWARIVTPILIAFMAFWDFILAGRSQWLPWLKWAILIIGLMGASVLLWLDSCEYDDSLLQPSFSQP